jgi:phytoene dehydrogenase-like protein
MQRARLGRLAVETLSRHGPDLGATTVESVLSPRDLEDRYGYPEGQAEQVEPALDQLLWMRPLPELARYRTPIDGLYLCGAGMHPGGGIAGAAGYNAAREVLRDLRNK